MRVLWVVNSIRDCFKDAFPNIKINTSSGNWVNASYEQIKNRDDVELFVLFCDKSYKKNGYLKSNFAGGTVYLIKLQSVSFGKKGNHKRVQLIKTIIKDINPNIIHLWGVETSLSYDVVNANPLKKTKIVTFIQGIPTIHKHYFVGGFFNENKVISLNPMVYLKLFKCKIKQFFYKSQSNLEKFIIFKSDYILTDNDWTISLYNLFNSKLKMINYNLPISNYFYKYHWDIKNIEKNSIFTVFGSDMNKGLFQLLKAIKMLKPEFPDIKCYFPGAYSKNDLFLKFANKYIKKNNLSNNVIFLGKLSQESMAITMSKCHIFVNPSCMEVQATTLREALIVGCPCVTSLSGSVLDIIQHSVNGYVYRYEEYEMLAAYIKRLLLDDDKCILFSSNAIKTLNYCGVDLYSIYKKVVSNE